MAVPRFESVDKGTFQIPVDWTVDEPLIRDLIEARLAELAT